MTPISVQITQPQKAALKKFAQERDLKFSELLRRALDEFIETEYGKMKQRGRDDRPL